MRQGEEQRSVWTRAGGLRMHARVFGEAGPGGSSVILVHGLVVSGRYMVPAAEKLAQDRRVFVPDLPGFGGSDSPPRVLDVAGLSGALSAWMEGIRLERATLVGNSMGCQVIAELAAHQPERVERAVLQGPTMDPRRRGVLGQVGRFLLDVPREPPSLLPIEFRDLLSAGTRRAWRTFRYALRDRIEEKLPHVGAPTMVVSGSRDPIAPRRWAEEAARMLPRGRLCVIPGAAHAANYGRAAEFARLVRGFIEEGGRPS
jgi:2-hydroxy-6-oxonona-2,4-dienedioate hydrolase